MTQQIDYTPAGLYARVSSDRQDMDLSVAAQLRALRDYAEKNGYVVAREYIDEAERGRIADMPQFHKMLNEASGPNAPSRRFSSGSSPALPESASMPWPSSPCSAAGEAGAVLAGRRVMLDNADTIATFAQEMSEFLKTSEVTETKAFVRSLVNEVAIRSGKCCHPLHHSHAGRQSYRARGGRRGRPQRASYEYSTFWWTHADSDRPPVSRSKDRPIHT